jgi:hypothetical protein
MDDALQQRLARLSRRQTYVLLFLVYQYLVALTWLALGDPTVRLLIAAVVPAVGLAVVAYLVALVRARRRADEQPPGGPDTVTDE